MNSGEKGLDKSPKVCIYLTEGEKTLIETLREIPYGEVTIEMHEGKPWRILRGVVARKL